MWSKPIHVSIPKPLSASPTKTEVQVEQPQFSWARAFNCRARAEHFWHLKNWAWAYLRAFLWKFSEVGKTEPRLACFLNSNKNKCWLTHIESVCRFFFQSYFWNQTKNWTTSVANIWLISAWQGLADKILGGKPVLTTHSWYTHTHTPSVSHTHPHTLRCNGSILIKTGRNWSISSLSASSFRPSENLYSVKIWTKSQRYFESQIIVVNWCDEAKGWCLKEAPKFIILE